MPEKDPAMRLQGVVSGSLKKKSDKQGWHREAPRPFKGRGFAVF
jgi:hypothetical protein